MDPSKLFLVHITDIFPSYDPDKQKYVMKCGGLKLRRNGSKAIYVIGCSYRPTLHWALNKVVDTLGHSDGSKYTNTQQYAVIEPINALSDVIWSGSGDDIVTLGDHYLSDQAIVFMPSREYSDHMKTLNCIVYEHDNKTLESNPNQEEDFRLMKSLIVNWFNTNIIPYNFISGYPLIAKDYLIGCQFEVKEIDGLLQLGAQMVNDSLFQKVSDHNNVIISGVWKTNDVLVVIGKNTMVHYNRQYHMNILKNPTNQTVSAYLSNDMFEYLNIKLCEIESSHNDSKIYQYERRISKINTIWNWSSVTEKNDQLDTIEKEIITLWQEKKQSKDVPVGLKLFFERVRTEL